MYKYKMLEHVLDSICLEAPENLKRYKEDSGSKKLQARSLAYIHLLLKAKFNLTSFDERERYITDGGYDGGIDAYYIDKENKIIYFIQSKYRNTEKNFSTKPISVDEIVKMEVSRITDGEETDSKGNKYNGKILGLIRNLQELDQIARYDFKIILLANVDNDIEKVLDKILDFPYEIYNYKRAYEELVFPILRGTCHRATDITVNLNLTSRNYTMEYEVEDGELSTNVQLFFVPTIEIAKLMSVHKNAILEYNPRSYLGLSRNPVNKAIKDQIVNENNNMFSLFNNGITILSDQTEVTSKTGRKGVGQLILKNPQIVNGGQTAHTLSVIYEDSNYSEDIFKNKEVLVKIITFDENLKDESRKLSLIEQLSQATNTQSKIVEADRRSNLEIQIDLQRYLFNKFGYCYHRKTGEFNQGISKKYLSNDQIIERDIFIRVAYAVNGSVAEARRSGEERLFKNENFEKFLNTSIGDEGYDKLFYSFIVHKYLSKIEKNPSEKDDKYSTKNYGNAIRYGKFAIVYVVSQKIEELINNKEISEKIVRELTDKVLNQWKEFENKQMRKDSNSRYFTKIIDDKGVTNFENNFANYYKGTTIDSDLSSYEFNYR